jgi:predicted amidophosphoribosyltransferase
MRVYKTEARNMAIAVKTSNDIQLESLMACYLAKTVCKGDILIPAPNHCGYADYTLRIAKFIQEMTGAEVCDCLKVVKHEPLYKKGKTQTREEKQNKLNMFLTANISPGKRILFVDNVIDTGATYAVANNLIPNLRPLIYSSTLKVNGSGKEWQIDN